MYYDRLSIIENVDKLSKYELKLTLKEDNPYFIYYLDFPLLDNENKITGEYIYSSDEEWCLLLQELTCVKIQL